MLCIDLYCGLGGWAEGFLAEGWDVIGFDVERHDYGSGGYPGQLVLADVLTLHGSQFRHADVIVASPPCQSYSYRAMPWKRAKALPPPDNSLFEACFRIQREASEAADRHIPLIVENVKGAQKWVGRAQWHYGSYYLWGDVPALMPVTRGDARASKNNGGSWFAQAHNTESGHSKNPVNGEKTSGLVQQRDQAEHTKVAGINFSGYGTPGYKPQGFNVTAAQRYREENGTKNRDGDGYERNHPEAFGWKAPRTSSRSDSRKAASAQIAKIPFPLAQWIAQVFKSEGKSEGERKTVGCSFASPNL
jgi:site-specific DNA-cytosine methylase